MNRLNSYQLKVIALIIMTIDHIAAYGMSIFSCLPNDVLHCIGRSAMPLFMYALVIGAKHTKRKKQFLMRLYIANIAIFIIWILLFFLLGNQFSPMPSVLFTYIYVLIYSFAFEKIIEKFKKREITSLIYIVVIIVVTVLPHIIYNLIHDPIINMLTGGQGVSSNNIIYIKTAETFLDTVFMRLVKVDGSVYFVIMGVIWYFAANKYICSGILILFSIWSFLGFHSTNFDIIANITGNYYAHGAFFSKLQFFMIFSALFMVLYDGKKGKSKKYFFYVYYPIHIFIISAVNLLFI